MKYTLFTLLNSILLQDPKSFLLTNPPVFLLLVTKLALLSWFSWIFSTCFWKLSNAITWLPGHRTFLFFPVPSNISTYISNSPTRLFDWRWKLYSEVDDWEGLSLLGKPSKKKKINWGKIFQKGGGVRAQSTLFWKKTKLVLKCVLSHFKPFKKMMKQLEKSIS